MEYEWKRIEIVANTLLDGVHLANNQEDVDRVYDKYSIKNTLSVKRKMHNNVIIMR